MQKLRVPSAETRHGPENVVDMHEQAPIVGNEADAGNNISEQRVCLGFQERTISGGGCCPA